MRIKAIACIDNNITSCEGRIEIHWKKGFQAYATWNLSSEGAPLASRSSNYYFKEDLHSEEDLMNNILSKIQEYRIDRKKVFSEVQLIV
jgi:hypothetical protein